MRLVLTSAQLRGQASWIGSGLQLNLVEAVATGIVEGEDGVLAVPDCVGFHESRPMLAEVETARSAGPGQQRLDQRELLGIQRMALAQRRLNVLAKFIEALDRLHHALLDAAFNVTSAK
jgi:hypothetical protein